MDPLEVAAGVWVAAGSAAPSTHDDDARHAAALPQWQARRFLHGRGLLRQLLRAVAPPLAGATIAYDRRGQPHLPDHPTAGISVSHSAGMVACAFATEARVGVDLQHPAASVSSTLARRLLRSHAPDVLALPPARAAEELTWVWTAQEACVKAAGAGLAGRPWDIDVPPRQHGGDWETYRWMCLRAVSRTPLSCAVGSAADGGDTPPHHPLQAPASL
ncbi:4'-phosphopantetheinyl transferase family protein [Streptomyces sp. NPDC055060]